MIFTPASPSSIVFIVYLLHQVGQLPGFQGNVPMALKALYSDSNITVAGDTGWMYSTDPLFGKVLGNLLPHFFQKTISG